MINLFQQIVLVSATTGILICLLSLPRKRLCKKYLARTRYYMEFVLWIRLLIPIAFVTNHVKIKSIINTSVEAVQKRVQEDTVGISNLKAIQLASSIDTFLTSDHLIWNRILIVWAIGAVILMGYNIIKFFLFRKYILYGTYAASNTQQIEIGKMVSEQLRLKRKCDIYITKRMISPMVYGVITPRLILPEMDYEKEELEFIIRHELVHFKRHDVCYKLLIMLACMIHWFNPLVWVLRMHSGFDLEYACDELVLQGCNEEQRKKYVKTIFNLMQLQYKNRFTEVLYFSGGEKNMKQRFLFILNLTKKRSGFGIIVILILCVLFMGIGMAIGHSTLSSIQEIPNTFLDKTVKKVLGSDDEGKIGIEETEENAIIFCCEFINQFTGAVSEQKPIAFNDYIRNQNLIKFADKMLELTQIQDAKKMLAVNYGQNNDFVSTEIGNIEKHIYYTKITFEYEGSGMTAQMIVEYSDGTFWIDDFYFGMKDGVDTISTGHISERHVDNPELWNDEIWVQDVFEQLEKYEQQLKGGTLD